MRADVYLVERGLVKSRTLAQKLIAEGCVCVDGQVISKASDPISHGEHDVVITPIEEMRYVSRGGLKLDGGLSAFDVNVTGKVLADVGASTGGFTHCLLTHGAARVYAIDAGHGQLDASLLANPCVRSMEGVNARYLTPNMLIEAEIQASGSAQNPNGSPFDGMVDGVVMDVSFISQTLLHPMLKNLVKPNGFFLTLIKPQFEVGKSGLGKHGVVKNSKYQQEAVERVNASAIAHDFFPMGIIQSPTLGGDGNVEYIGYFLKKN